MPRVISEYVLVLYTIIINYVRSFRLHVKITFYQFNLNKNTVTQGRGRLSLTSERRTVAVDEKIKPYTLPPLDRRISMIVHLFKQTLSY